MIDLLSLNIYSQFYIIVTKSLIISQIYPPKKIKNRKNKKRRKRRKGRRRRKKNKGRRKERKI